LRRRTTTLDQRHQQSATQRDESRHSPYGIGTRQVVAETLSRYSLLRRSSTYLKNHLEPDWNNVPNDHIKIDTVNDWAWKKKKRGLSWVTIKNVLRTMQGVLSASSNSKTVPFYQDGLAIRRTFSLPHV